MAQHAEVVQRVDVTRFGGERGLIVALRVGQAAIAMGRETAGEYGVHDGEDFWPGKANPAFSHTGAALPEKRG
jgi:hypothetical protein